MAAFYTAHFNSALDTLGRILEGGYYFSINEAMCKSKKGQNIIAKLPKNRVLVETDAPFIEDVLPYKNFNVYYYLSELWKMKIDDVFTMVFNNFLSLQNHKLDLFSYEES